ncbi:MAG: hypothetical protein QW416_03860 [Candidatus Nitrosocaldaceae archaeon]
MVSCLYCRRRLWYRRDLSNPFATNKERTYAYECTKCKIIIIIKNESDRKSRGTKEYWSDKSIVKGRVIKGIVKNSE